MKKKTVKKLVLAKETVRDLAGSDLADLVHGGISTGLGASCARPCLNSDQPSCTC